MAPPLPPGFVLDKKPGGAPPLPPGFVLDKVTQPVTQPVAQPATPQPDPNLIGLPIPGADGQPDPKYDVPGVGQPATVQPATPLFNNPMRGLELGTKATVQGVTDLVGLPVDLTALLMNLGLAGADMIPGVDTPRVDKPFGGSESLFDPVEQVLQAQPETMQEKTAYDVNRFASGAITPWARQVKAVDDVVSAVPFVRDLMKPGVSPANDLVAGAGAGAGVSLYDQTTPQEVQQALGPIGQVLAALAGGFGANMVQTGVQKTPGMIDGTARAVTGIGPRKADLPQTRADGSQFSAEDADAAALYVQSLAARPSTAAGTIREAANDLRGYTSPDSIPTTGPLSGDVGLIAAEKGARQAKDPAVRNKFALRDQAVERSALDNVDATAPEGAIGRMFTDAADAEYAARVAAAQQGVDQAVANLSAKNAERASDAFAVGMNRDLAVPASGQIDDIITNRYLRPAQDRKNEAFRQIDPMGTEYRDPGALLDTADQIEMGTGRLSDPTATPSGWIDRIRGLVDADGNVSQVSFKDLNEIRPQLSEQIASARKAGNYTLADNLAKIKRVIDTETDRLAAQGGEAGFRAKNALAEYARFAEVWARGPGDEAAKFRKDFNLDRNGRTTTPPSDTAARFIRPSDPERAASLRRVVDVGSRTETKLQDYGYRQDNPAVQRGNTEWLDEKIRDAEASYGRTNGITGATTAYFRKALTLPVGALKNLKGARGEVRSAGDPGYDALMDAVGKSGWAPGNDPILIEINHRGEAFVTEGNTRLAVAKALGIKEIDAEVKWLNGGEMVEGPWSPGKIAGLLKGNSRIDPDADSAVRDFLMADLAKSINGPIDANMVGKWMSKWGSDALDLSPTLRSELDAIMQKADVDVATVRRLEAELKDARAAEVATAKDASPVLGKDPVRAIDALMNSGDARKQIRDIVARVGKDPKALNGMKAAVRDWLIERGTTAGLARTGDGRNPLSFAKLDSAFKSYENVLAEVLSPREMNHLRVAHRFLASLENLKSANIPGSQTSPNSKLAQAWEEFSGPLEAGLKMRYGILKGGGIMRTLGLWQKMLPGGAEGVNELVQRMYFDPELAAHLLTREVKEVGTSKWNKRLLILLAAGQSSQDMVQTEVEK